MANNPYQKYKNTQVETASQEKLLLMLYDGAIKFTKQGIKGIKEEDYELTNNALNKVQAILSEFQTTLDHDQAPELTADLDALYDYMKRRLIKGNVGKNIDPVEEVLGMLKELRETWQQAAEKLKKKGKEGNRGVSIEG
ncbi:flagellar export chaperone FliS [Halanaerocella petrolearia]